MKIVKHIPPIELSWLSKIQIQGCTQPKTLKYPVKMCFFSFVGWINGYTYTLKAYQNLVGT